MKTLDEIKKEMQIVELGRDCFKTIRCSRKTDIDVVALAAKEESEYQRRLDELTETLAKVQKRSAA